MTAPQNFPGVSDVLCGVASVGLAGVAYWGRTVCKRRDSFPPGPDPHQGVGCTRGSAPFVPVLLNLGARSFVVMAWTKTTITAVERLRLKSKRSVL